MIKQFLEKQSMRRFLKNKHTHTLYICVCACLSACTSFNPSPVSVHLAGDSTMVSYSEQSFPQQGWGEALNKYAKDYVTIKNYAKGGRSTKSFIEQNRWKDLTDKIERGDYVIIQFGHNDSTEEDSSLYTTPEEYKKNMNDFVQSVRDAGGYPIIATSITSGKAVLPQKDRLTPYVAAAREVAKEAGCDLVDLNSYAEKVFEDEPDKRPQLYMIFPRGTYPNFPDGKSDQIHTNFRGAVFYAKAFIEISKKNKYPIGDLFVDSKLTPLEDAFDQKQ